MSLRDIYKDLGKSVQKSSKTAKKSNPQKSAQKSVQKVAQKKKKEQKQNTQTQNRGSQKATSSWYQSSIKSDKNVAKQNTTAQAQKKQNYNNSLQNAYQKYKSNQTKLEDAKKKNEAKNKSDLKTAYQKSKNINGNGAKVKTKTEYVKNNQASFNKTAKAVNESASKKLKSYEKNAKYYDKDTQKSLKESRKQIDAVKKYYKDNGYLTKDKLKNTSTDLTREEYGKLTTGAMTVTLKTQLNNDKKLKKKVSDKNVSDYINGKASMGALDQMTQGLSVSNDPDYKYTKEQNAIMDKAKSSKAYMAGQFVGAGIEFGLGGTGALGSGLAKTGSKQALRQIAKNEGRQAVKKEVGKRIAKETLADSVVSAPLNIGDSAKMSYKDGKFDKKEFAKEMAMNIGADVALGGSVSGLTHGVGGKKAIKFDDISKNFEKANTKDKSFIAKNLAEYGTTDDKAKFILSKSEQNNLAKLSAKKNAGTLTSKESVEYKNLKAKADIAPYTQTVQRMGKGASNAELKVATAYDNAIADMNKWSKVDTEEGRIKHAQAKDDVSEYAELLSKHDDDLQLVEAKTKEAKPVVKKLNSFGSDADVNVSTGVEVQMHLNDMGSDIKPSEIDGFRIKDSEGKSHIIINASNKNADPTSITLGHEVSHLLEGSEKEYDGVKKLVKEIVGENKYNAEIDKMSRLYRNVEGANAENEATANFIGRMFSSDNDGRLLKDLYVKDKTGFRKVADFFEKLNSGEVKIDNPKVDELDKLCRNILSGKAGEFKALNAKYKLNSYSDKQIKNWEHSKNIVICESDSHLLEFVKGAKEKTNIGKKLYLGVVPDNLATYVEKTFGIDIANRNVALDSDEIRKIFASHGTPESEVLRGQKPITDADFLKIKDVIGNPDKITLDDRLYNGRPILKFEKEIDGRTTVVAYDSKKSKDLRVQTMYIGNKKRNLATPTPEQADVNTPKASSGTVPLTKNIANEADNVKVDMKLTDNKKTIDESDPEWSRFSNEAEAEATSVKEKEPTQDEIDNAKTGQELEEEAFRTEMQRRADEGMVQEFGDVAETIKKYGIKVDDTLKGELAYRYGSFDRARKDLFGRMNLKTDAKGSTIDSLYMELHDQYGNYFPTDVVNGADQLNYIIDFLDDFYTAKGRLRDVNVELKAEKKQAVSELKVETEPTTPKAEEKLAEVKSEPNTDASKAKPTYNDYKVMIERGSRSTTKTEMNETARKAQKNIIDSYGGDDEFVKTVTDNTSTGMFGKGKGMSADEATTKATKEIKNDGFDEAFNKYMRSDVLEDPKLASARARELLTEINNMKREGKVSADELATKYSQVVEKLSALSNFSGRALQAMKDFRTATPEGRVRVAKQEIERLQTRYKDRLNGRDLEISDEKLMELVQAEGKRKDELLDEINTEIWNQIPATWIEKMNEMRHCFMLFNAKTHLRNVVGNTMFKGVRALSYELESALMNSKPIKGKIEKMGGSVDKTHVKISEVRAHSKYLDDEFKAIYSDSGSRNKYLEGVRPAGVPTFKFKPLQKIIDINYGALEWEDLKLCLVPEFKKSYVSWCKSKCPENVKLEAFMRNMSDKEKDSARRYALAEGEYATFRDSSKLASMITGKKQQWADKKGETIFGTAMYRTLHVVAEGNLPFVKTPVNIARRSIDYSPAAVMRGVAKVAQAKDADMFKSAIHDLSTGLTGTGVFLLGGFLYSQGWVNIKAGQDSGDAYFDRDMGYQDYSLLIHAGGKEYSATIDWMAPVQVSLFMGASAYKALEDGSNGNLDDEDLSNIFYSMTTPFTDMSFMSAPMETVDKFMENLSSKSSEDLRGSNAGNAFKQLLLGDIPQNYVSGFIPQAIAQTAGLTDKYQRDTRSTKENALAKGWDSSTKQLVNKVPGLRNRVLNPKLDRYGDDKVTGGNIATRLLDAYINPAKVKEINKNERDVELIKIRNSIEDKTSKDYKYFYYNFTGNPSYDLKNGKRMTYDEAYKYGKTSRVEQTKMVDSMIHAKSYKNMPNKLRQDEVNQMYWIATTVADRKTYGDKYAISNLEEKVQEDYKEYQSLTTKSGKESRKTFLDYYVSKEMMYNRAHPSKDDAYYVKAYCALKTGDKELLKSLDIKDAKIASIKKYREETKGNGVKAMVDFTDGLCNIASGFKKNGISSWSNAFKSASAGLYAGTEDELSENVYRALGLNWNGAQAGAGFVQKYGHTIKEINKMKADLNGTRKRSEVEAYIESLGLGSDDEMACAFEVLYSGGQYRNPYKSQIADHLKWNENNDDEWGSGTGSGRRYGHGGGHRFGHGRRGGHGGGSKGGSKDWYSWYNTNVGTSSTSSSSSGSKSSYKSPLTEAYRKRQRARQMAVQNK